MKPSIVAACWLLLACSTPAFAQLGGISGVLGKAQKAQEAKQKLDDLTFSDEEERTIGADVSEKIRTRFGVVQNRDVHKYVTLVGRTVAKETDRPNLDWTFIVLDTDGVNAFASPGGFVHITRGALALIQNEAELASVLAHEIGHITRKHTINAIRKSNAEKLLSDATLSNRGVLLNRFADLAYGQILEGAFDRGDELDADKASAQFAPKAGYAPMLADFLARLDDRNKDQPERNGLFASHPETKERIEKLRQLAAAARVPTKGEVRYKANVTYQPTPITAIAAVPDGSAGLTGGKGDAKTAKAEEPPRKKGFGLGGLKQTVAPEKQSAQVSASGGARGVGPDRAAKGGGNPAIVKTQVSAAEIEEFRKGIV
jgi:predicted Zn-dependent protease